MASTCAATASSIEASSPPARAAAAGCMRSDSFCGLTPWRGLGKENVPSDATEPTLTWLDRQTQGVSLETSWSSHKCSSIGEVTGE
eukprot:3146759-Prymnesium_polylepis.1